jgi:hypothetical protein
LFLSRDELVEYDDESLSCLLFVLDEILFTLLLLLLPPAPLELCLLLLSFSLSLEEDDDEVRDDVLEGIGPAVGAFVELLEKGICAFEPVEELDELLFVVLDFFCLLLDDDKLLVASGSLVGRLERDDECEISDSFSGDEGESLEFVSCDIGLYGGIGFTLPPFFNLL